MNCLVKLRNMNVHSFLIHKNLTSLEDYQFRREFYSIDLDQWHSYPNSLIPIPEKKGSQQATFKICEVYAWYQQDIHPAFSHFAYHTCNKITSLSLLNN